MTLSPYSRGVNLPGSHPVLKERRNVMAEKRLPPLEVAAQALELIAMCLREIQAASDSSGVKTDA